MHDSYVRVPECVCMCVRLDYWRLTAGEKAWEIDLVNESVALKDDDVTVKYADG